jgi:Chaperone of endosialidase
VIKGDKVGVNLNSPTDSLPESLTVNGNVLADSFVRRSSQRWKTNIQTLEGALEKVQALRGVSYDWKDNGKHDIGLVAEEVGQVVPEAMVYAANGQDATSVDYALLVPVLIEAIKEQQAMIEELQAHIDQGLY